MTGSLPTTSNGGPHGTSGYSSKQLRIALAQLSCADGDKDRNLRVICDSIVEASRQNADLILFPEEFLTGFTRQPELGLTAEPRNGEALAAVMNCSREHSMGVVLGFAELEPSSGAFFNTTVLLSKRGEPLLFYRKTHLWLGERLTCGSGDVANAVVEFEGIKTGMLTCYDIEFPEAARCLGVAGAELILVTTGNMDPWQHRHRIFIVSRALENHAFVAYCNRADSGAFYNHTGDSALVDPFGRLLSDLGPAERIETSTAHMSLVGGSKREMNYYIDRRPEIYGAVCERTLVTGVQPT